MIGIITRKDITPNNNTVNIVYDAISNIIYENNEIPIGIIQNDLVKIKNIINSCDGIILQGGDSYDNNDLEITRYIYENNIPCLGICLGMQMMGIILGGKLIKVNEYLNTMHSVLIKNSSIYNNLIIKANSRHKECLTNIDEFVTGFSFGGIPELIEDKTKNFFVGVQWHPENLYNIDCNAKILFNKYLNVVKTTKKCCESQ